MLPISDAGRYRGTFPYVNVALLTLNSLVFLYEIAVGGFGFLFEGFGFLFGGTLLVEVIYSYPGLGNLMVEAVRNTDLPIIQGAALVFALAVLTINLAVDVVYIVVNPKLRRAR